MLTGFADPKIDSNDKRYNENVTVLEWLNQMTSYKDESLQSQAGMSFHSSSMIVAVVYWLTVAGTLIAQATSIHEQLVW